MELDKRSFAWYNTIIQDWYAATGDYEIQIGASSQNIHLTAAVHLTATQTLPLNITPVGDLIADPRSREFGLSLKKKMDTFFGTSGADTKLSDDDSEENSMGDAIASSMPIHNATLFGLLSKEELLKEIDRLNNC